jgi:hypothetical protein
MGNVLQQFADTIRAAGNLLQQLQGRSDHPDVSGLSEVT